MRGVTGENLLSLLERRLDNVVQRMGFVTSRAEGRMLVRQGHFAVNGKRVNIPSARVRTGDSITLTERGKKTVRIADSLAALEARSLPSWVEIDIDTKTGRIVGNPVREEITIPIQEQLIVELYSR